ncbi:MAG: hypothetical protein LBK24_01085 [Puniceicoccales bacterium]|nr:hypothetical protein [Puniceicoccales bacterium]
MTDTALVMQPIDKLFLNNKISAAFATDSLFTDPYDPIFSIDTDGKKISSFVRGAYLALLGVKLCALVVKKEGNEIAEMQKEIVEKKKKIGEINKEIAEEMKGIGTMNKEITEEMEGIAKKKKETAEKMMKKMGIA